MGIISFFLINFLFGFISTIFILYAHRRFCYQFYHTHTIKCVPNAGLTLTPNRGINKLKRELNKARNEISTNKALKIGNKVDKEEESKRKFENVIQTKNNKVKNGNEKAVKDNDPAYIDLTSIDEDLNKAKK
uniref:Uncharacterized protein n=1 Tax=Strongyloides venezuelensis TaxID=75913 RepID=A0A0K0F076_STRVS